MNTLLRNKAFLIVTGSDLLQNLAIWIRNMAILYYVMDRTQGSPIAVSLITVLEYAPIFVFSIIGGALADRWNSKRTMILGYSECVVYCHDYQCFIFRVLGDSIRSHVCILYR